jgi:hypothetical protein
MTEPTPDAPEPDGDSPPRPEAGPEPVAAKPKTAKPKTAKSKTADPKTAKPKAAKPKDPSSKPADTETGAAADATAKAKAKPDPVPLPVGPLADPREDAFARNRARKQKIRPAAEAAGFGSGSHIYELDKDPAVIARVESIARNLAWGATPDLAPVIDELACYARMAAQLGSAAGMKAARDLMATVAELKMRLPEAAAPGAAQLAPPLTAEQWQDKYAPKA